MKTIMLRRQDGLAKMISVDVEADSRLCDKSGVHFKCVYSLSSHAGDGSALWLCEEDDPDVTQKEPFVRVLPGVLRHELFFGDLIFVEASSNGEVEAVTTEDMRSVLDGTHPKWCMRNIRDVTTFPFVDLTIGVTIQLT